MCLAKINSQKSEKYIATEHKKSSICKNKLLQNSMPHGCHYHAKHWNKHLLYKTKNTKNKTNVTVKRSRN